MDEPPILDFPSATPDTAPEAAAAPPTPVDAGPSPVWFGYIALGITLVSLLLGLVLLGWAAYWLLKVVIAG